MKRVFIFRNSIKHKNELMNANDSDDEDDDGDNTNGKIVIINENITDIEDFIQISNQKLKINGKKLYLNNGIRIEDINEINDNDTVYVSEGEKFAKKGKNLNKYGSTENEITINMLNEWITLNIGGTCFKTTRTTLTTREPASMLARMFDAENAHCWKHRCTTDGAILIDRSAKYFEPILNYLRHGNLIVDKDLSMLGVLEEAKFYSMDNLIEIIEKEIQMADAKNSINRPMNRLEVIQSLMQTKVDTYQRLQSINLQGADLSRLDLSWINFKYANLSGANLNGSNISYSCFERADLSRANLENAKCYGSKMTCVNLESAILKNADFEDPTGSNRHAILEGANLKNVNGEACNMTGINLRVATLKNANFENSIMRNANLAGSDLENCNLNGSDLTDANLRGANLVGTTFNNVHNALHMSTSRCYTLVNNP